MLASGFNSYSQTTSTITTENASIQGDYYTAEAGKMVYDQDNKITELTGDVYFVTNAIEINDADKVVFNEETKEITAHGNFTWRMRIPIEVVDTNGAKTRSMMRYKLGDDKAYLE
ncbi:hypothetical protein CHU92_02435 [Flavobacterium cyanobacteriorum]|uniref:Organic solvent tolerance-like N-terminal domain-containing protein n=1 Tax=Flavobacterium cyanobacteriorum TaxID=2022802 RepID=A0A255ZUC2_9FLAO|nr:hypothetical protein CHU92_02435 [Flavobacterium cyanobacteriorum]